MGLGLVFLERFVCWAAGPCWGLGPHFGLGQLLGTWLLHTLVPDLVEGHGTCPKPEATWPWGREECSTQPPLPDTWGKKGIGEKP